MPSYLAKHHFWVCLCFGERLAFVWVVWWRWYAFTGVVDIEGWDGARSNKLADVLPPTGLGIPVLCWLGCWNSLVWGLWAWTGLNHIWSSANRREILGLLTLHTLPSQFLWCISQTHASHWSYSSGEFWVTRRGPSETVKERSAQGICCVSLCFLRHGSTL